MERHFTTWSLKMVFEDVYMYIWMASLIYLKEKNKINGKFEKEEVFFLHILDLLSRHG